MKKIKMLKTAKKSKMWRKNQKLWFFHFTGSQASKVVGRYRGKGRYVCAWYHWNDKTLPDVIECDVKDEFYKMINRIYNGW